MSHQSKRGASLLSSSRSSVSGVRMTMSKSRRVWCLLALGASQFSPPAYANDEKTLAQLSKALSFRPRQPSVEYELVDNDKLSQCTLESEVTRDDGKGYWVTGPGGQPLRWFRDTNKDNKLDKWSYYNNGVEVYRETDTDFNETADEYRWLNTEGIRVGVDKNEDGSIDTWAIISAEEVTAEVVAAAIERDAARFSRLLITDAEIRALGLGNQKQSQLQQRVTDAKTQFAAWAAGQDVVAKDSEWTHFAAERPGCVPAGTDGSRKDIFVYENAVALLNTKGKPRQLLVGTLIQVDNAWRLVDLPRAVTEGAELNDAGVFFSASFTPNAPADAAATGGISQAMERLVNELQVVDEKLVSGSSRDSGALQAQRADVLEKLISAAETDAERTTWVQQFADTVSAAAQTGEYPDGVKRLQTFSRKLISAKASKDELAYVAFRTLTADHNQRMLVPKADYEKLQEEYLGNLRAFVEEYPDSKDSAEAMLQIALSAEFSGEIKEAAVWYAKAAKSFGDSLAGKKAEGALRRLNLVGNPFRIKGTTLDGQSFASDTYLGGPVIYHCWASWCDGCKAEMRALKELQDKYAKNKLRIVGINLDNEATQGVEYLKTSSFTWPHLYDKGGLDSTLAVGYGVLTLPANFVVDKQGKVIKTGVHWTELDALIEELVK